jgi:hypothetical protein
MCTEMSISRVKLSAVDMDTTYNTLTRKVTQGDEDRDCRAVILVLEAEAAEFCNARASLASVGSGEASLEPAEPCA